MNGYIVVGGIVLLVFGVAVFMWSYNQIQDYQTTLGQLGRALNSDAQARYADAQMTQMIGIVFAIAGIGALIFGAPKKQAAPKPSNPA